MLIATLPPVYREELLSRIISCPEIGDVRYNTGMVSPHSPEETLRLIKHHTDEHRKKLWIDLKGRQLRVTHWALPDYGNIIINHHVEVDGEVWVHLRGNERLRLKFARGNVLYVDPPPRQAVGEGQSLNIVGDHVTIKGYLTDTDRAYIRAARILGIKNFMLSFAENYSDICEVRDRFANAVEGGTESERTPDLILKIESPTGLGFISALTEEEPVESHRLMAARDDLFVTLKAHPRALLSALKSIIAKDSEAIVASRLFKGIEYKGQLALSDITDIEFMKHLGYKHFMLSDEICHQHFDAAITAWKSMTS